jgi:heptosyltransferase-2
MSAESFVTRVTDRPGEVRLLVRHPNWVGDALIALPALEALRRSAPGAVIHVLAKPWVAGVVTLSGLADGVVPWRGEGEPSGTAGTFPLAARLRRGGYHGAVLLQNAFQAALIAFAARIPNRGGYATDSRRLLLTHPVPVPAREGGGTHQVGYYTGLVRALGFTAPAAPVPRIAVSPDRRGIGAIALAPGAAFGPAKMWPAERYVALGRLLAAEGHPLLVLGSGREEEVCRRVAEGIGPAAVSLAGGTSLEEAAAVLAACRLLVCNDSGLMHLGAAVGAPLVAIFGSTDPDATGPLSSRCVVLRGSAPCAPCFRRTCPRSLECFLDVGVEKAATAVHHLLERRDEP